MSDKETRIITAEALELRAAGDGEDGPTIAGYGAVFNSPSLDLGGFREIIAPGAFSRSLKSRGGDVMSFFNHDPSKPLGSRKAGNLTVSEDDKGLVYEVKPPATTYANDLVEAMRAKLVRGSSFTFSVKKDTWTEDSGVQVRTLLDVDLFELGPVTNPAYPAANSQVRALLESRGITFDGDQARAPIDLLGILAEWKPRDATELRAALAALSALLPDPPPPEEEHDLPTDDVQLDLARRTRRLRLLGLRLAAR